MEIPATERLNAPYEQIVDFCQRWHINELALFGSVLREDFRPDSDVDVLVTFAPNAPYSLFDLIRMENELSKLFGRDVDLIEKAGLQNPFRRHAILKSSQVIYMADFVWQQA
jgi:predicted nucleotidyltransferase